MRSAETQETIQYSWGQYRSFTPQVFCKLLFDISSQTHHGRLICSQALWWEVRGVMQAGHGKQQKRDRGTWIEWNWNRTLTPKGRAVAKLRR